MKQLFNLILAIVSLILAYYFGFTSVHYSYIGYNAIAQYYYIGSFICWCISAYLISLNLYKFKPKQY